MSSSCILTPFSPSYGYDLAGRAVKLQTGNGHLCWNVYDVLGRLKKRTLYADVTAQTKLTDLDYDYDALGNVLSQLENWPGSALRPIGWRVTTMTYDDSNRLETETVSQSATPESLPGAQLIRTVYSYDAANNRQTKTVLGGDEPGYWDYHYNTANQLRAWQRFDDEGGTLLKSALLFYDDDGNRTSQEISQIGSPKKTTLYSWDAQNRLMGVTLPDSSQHSYVYDYRTRRIGTRSEGILPSGGGAATSKTTSIVFAGGLSLAEWEQSGTPHHLSSARHRPWNTPVAPTWVAESVDCSTRCAAVRRSLISATDAATSSPRAMPQVS